MCVTTIASSSLDDLLFIIAATGGGEGAINTGNSKLAQSLVPRLGLVLTLLTLKTQPPKNNIKRTDRLYMGVES